MRLYTWPCTTNSKRTVQVDQKQWLRTGIHNNTKNIQSHHTIRKTTKHNTRSETQHKQTNAQHTIAKQTWKYRIYMLELMAAHINVGSDRRLILTNLIQPTQLNKHMANSQTNTKVKHHYQTFKRVPLRRGLWEHEPDEVLDANDDRDEYWKMNYRDMVSNAG